MTDDDLRKLLAETTPGPWFQKDRNNHGEVVIGAPDGDCTPWSVAIACGLCGYPDDRSDANARAIATWPDLAAEVLRLRAKVAAGAKLAEASVAVTQTMRVMLEAGDAIRNLSALGRASLTGEMLTAEAALAAWEAAQ